MKNLQINTKKIAILLGMSIGLTLVGGCSNKNNNKKVSDTVISVKDKTCLDEILSYSGMKIMDELQEYIELSSELNKINIKDTKVNIENYELYTPLDIKKLIVIYKSKDAQEKLSKEEFKEIKKEIIASKYLINEYLANDGYEITEEFLKAVLKSEILDAKELDKNSINTITILPEEESHINSTPSGFNDYIYITDDIKTNDKNIKDTLYSLYSMQSNEEQNNNNEIIEYNKNRNKTINNAINNGIKTLKKDYIIKKDILKKTKRK